MRLRIVEYQDWTKPPTSSDDDGHGGGGADEDDDSGDNNYNGYHPGFDVHRGRSSGGPRSVRLAGSGDGAPSLGRESGPTFQTRAAVVVGTLRAA